MQKNILNGLISVLKNLWLYFSNRTYCQFHLHKQNKIKKNKIQSGGKATKKREYSTFKKINKYLSLSLACHFASGEHERVWVLGGYCLFFIQPLVMKSLAFENWPEFWLHTLTLWIIITHQFILLGSLSIFHVVPEVSSNSNTHIDSVGPFPSTSFVHSF